ncbi:hypothetical protein BH11PLA2_BH11PLA2_13100 [soil metagenome]
MNKYILLLLIVVAACGCKKKSVASAAPDPAPAPSGATQSARDTNYQAGGGAVTNVHRRAERVKVEAELQQLGQLMTVQYNELGRMPKIDEIKSYLNQAQNILGHINQGNIILTGTTNYSGLWAYQAEADTLGGSALVGGTPNKYSKEEFAQIPK